MGIKNKRVKGHSPKKLRVKRFSDTISIQASKGQGICTGCHQYGKIKYIIYVKQMIVRTAPPPLYACDNKCKSLLLLQYI